MLPVKELQYTFCFYLRTIISKTYLKYSQYHALSDDGAPTLSNRLHLRVRVWECEFTGVSYFSTGPSYFMTLVEELSEKKIPLWTHTPTLSPLGAIGLRVWELHRWRVYDICVSEYKITEKSRIQEILTLLADI